MVLSARFLMALMVMVMVMVSGFSAHAMQLEVHGNQLFATGEIGNDLIAFEEALAKPGVDTVVFVNSPGGDLWTSLRVGRLIASKGLKTVIAGTCSSGCSIMFMGGKERSFSDAFPPAMTFNGIHGGISRETKRIDSTIQPEIYAFYKLRIGDRFDSAIMNRALYDMEDGGALLRVFDSGRSFKRIPYHCKSSGTPRAQCTEFPGADALSLGIVTTNTMTQLVLPQAFRTMSPIFGYQPAQLWVEPPGYIAKLAESCKDDKCRKSVAGFPASRGIKVLAVGLGTGGMSMSINDASVVSAYVKAIFNCNHLDGKPTRLCTAKVVNEFDVSAIKAASDASHASALARLTVPDAALYGNEEFGGLLARVNGLRTQQMEGSTPTTAPGIRILGTQELAKALTNVQRPVLIDVTGVDEAIPGSTRLLLGGRAADDAAVDAAMEARFSGLLKLLAPDLARELVFYAEGRDTWYPVNAALRAKKLGYTQVSWYRGGLASWKAAGLPVAMPSLNAVN